MRRNTCTGNYDYFASYKIHARYETQPNFFLWLRTPKQCCGSGAGSGRICIVFPDPDRDLDALDPIRIGISSTHVFFKFFMKSCQKY
jgi:hypothetical protein